MTITGALIAVVTRKVRALIAEVRALVNTAKSCEQFIVASAKVDIQKIKTRTANEVKLLRDDLITRINKL